MPSKVKKLPNLQIPHHRFILLVRCGEIVTGFLIGLSRHALVSPKHQSGYLVKYSHSLTTQIPLSREKRHGCIGYCLLFFFYVLLVLLFQSTVERDTIWTPKELHVYAVILVFITTRMRAVYKLHLSFFLSCFFEINFLMISRCWSHWLTSFFFPGKPLFDFTCNFWTGEWHFTDPTCRTVRSCLVRGTFFKSLSHQKESYYFIVLNKICINIFRQLSAFSRDESNEPN